MHGPGEPLHGWHSRPLGAAHLLALLHASCHSPAESQGPPRHPSATLAPTDHLACILLSCLNLMPMGGEMSGPFFSSERMGHHEKSSPCSELFSWCGDREVTLFDPQCSRATTRQLC